MVTTNFYIGGGDYWGKNSPNDLVNKEYIPRLMELGIKLKDLKEVANMFAEVYDIGYINGGNDREGDMNDY